MSKKIEVPVQDFRIFTNGNAEPLVTIKIPLECCGVKMEILPGTPEGEFNRFVGKERCEHCKSYPGIWQAYVVDKIHFNGTRPRKVSMRGNLHNVSYEKITFDHTDALSMIKDSLATKKVEPMFFDTPTFRDTEEPGQLTGLAFEINRHASSFVETLPGNQFRYRDNGVRKIIKDLIVNNKEFLPVLRWGRRRNNFLFNVYFDPIAIRKLAASKKEKLVPAKKNEEVPVVQVNATNTIANIVVEAAVPRVIDPAQQPIPDVEHLPSAADMPSAPVPLSMDLQNEMLAQLAASIRNESNVRTAPARSPRDQAIADRIAAEGMQMQPRGSGMSNATNADPRSLRAIWGSFDSYSNYGQAVPPGNWVVGEPILLRQSDLGRRDTLAEQIRAEEDRRIFELMAADVTPPVAEPMPEPVPVTPTPAVAQNTGTSVYGMSQARRLADTRARAQEGTRIARARRAVPSASALPVTHAGPRPRTRRARGV